MLSVSWPPCTIAYMYPALGLSLSPSLLSREDWARFFLKAMHFDTSRGHCGFAELPRCFLSARGMHRFKSLSLTGVCKVPAGLEERVICVCGEVGSSGGVGPECSPGAPTLRLLSQRWKADHSWIDRQILSQVIFWPGGQFPRRGSSPSGSRFSEALI